MRDKYGDFHHRSYYPMGRVVTVYGTTRLYGGPEEGGWWFDWRVPLKSWRANGLRRFKKAVDKALAFIEEQRDWTGDFNGHEDLEVWCEDCAGEYATRQRPYYC